MSEEKDRTEEKERLIEASMEDLEAFFQRKKEEQEALRKLLEALKRDQQTNPDPNAFKKIELKLFILTIY